MKRLPTQEGKEIVADTDNDVRLFNDAQSSVSKSTNLYLHETKNGKRYYYLHELTPFEKLTENYKIIDERTAIEFIRLKAEIGIWGLANHEKTLAEKYFPGIFEDD
jgi:hypothetical protein